MKQRVRGVVKSNKMDKAVTVVVEELFKHPAYEKYITQTKTFKARDANEVAQPGDLVEIEKTRPLSRTMHWRLVRVIRPATLAEKIPAPEVVASQVADQAGGDAGV